jgi:glycosyltransferase involved in cell wall biosynthesis
MALIDIIMPLYNKAATVERSVRSILNQRLSDWRLIVVDDGGTDDGAERVRRFQDRRIELIHQPNQGAGAARNAGLACANADFIAFLDADDEWLPDYLTNALQAFQANPDVGLVGTMYQEYPPWRNVQRLYARRNVREGIYQLRGDESARWVGGLVPFFSCWNSVVRLDAARRYGVFFDKARDMKELQPLSGFSKFVPGTTRYQWEDVPFFLRLVFNEKFMILGPTEVIYHREASELFPSGRPHPAIPFLDYPELVLNACPDAKKKLMCKVLDYYALKCIRGWARFGLAAQSRELFGRYPGVRSFGIQYYRCRYELLFSRWFPYWVRFKCEVGPPVRLFLAKVSNPFRKSPTGP